MTKLWKVSDDGTQKTSEILEELRKHFEVYSYYDSEQLDKDFPAPKKPTTRYFKANVEADEENKNKSANEFNQENCITLRERLILELNYFLFTGKHLDEDNITLCAGSRDSDGGVPGVDWDGDELQVNWCGPDSAGDDLRVRVAVSNPYSLNSLSL